MKRVWRDIDDGFFSALVGETAKSMLAEKLIDQQLDVVTGASSSFSDWLALLIVAVLIEDHEDAYARAPSRAEVDAYTLLAQMCMGDAVQAIDACLEGYKRGRGAAPDPLLNAARELDRDTRRSLAREYAGEAAELMRARHAATQFVRSLQPELVR
jgi:hypothetical protein